jgi:hypothetical protein
MSANAQTTQEENWGRARPIQQEVNKSLVHYLFLPVDLSAGQVPGGGLDVNHTVMNTGLRLVRRGRLTLVQDKAWMNPRAPIGGDAAEVGDDEREMGQPFTVGKRQEMAYAQDIAYGLATRTYLETGLIVVARLTGIDEPVARWVEQVLLPAKVGGILELHRHLQKFDIADMPQFPDGVRWQGWRMSTGIVPEELVMSVRNEMLQSCATGESYVRSFYADQRSEIQQAMVPGGRGGNTKITEKLRLFSRELGLDAPDDLAAAAERTRAGYEAAAPVAAQLQLPPELTEMFKLLLSQGFKITPPEAPPAQAPILENWAPAQSSTRAATNSVDLGTDSASEDQKTTGPLVPTAGAAEEEDETPFAAKCGAPKTDGSGTCTQPAGSGTDHPGTGRCRFHPEQ